MSLRRFHTFHSLFYQKPTNLKNKKHSSQQWLVRQLKDPYVEKAKAANYRCRSAFKLIEINQKYKILTPGLVVVDCGAAPGSWTQVATRYTNADSLIMDADVGKVIAIDKQPIHHIEGATLFGNIDFTKNEAQELIKNALDGKFVELVMSDMAPNAAGVKELDHENIIELAYTAFKFALEVSCYDATFLVKVWDGGKCPQLESDIARFYKRINIVRPDATRDESSEKFILARGFKGLKTISNMNKDNKNVKQYQSVKATTLR